MNERVNFDIITKYINDNHLTVKEFCKQCKISVTTYYKIKHGDEFSLVSLFKIALKIEKPLEQFYN